ncbi:PREDICTED: mitogen-activated protein kinase kinase kinase 5-like, partial [Priapulus caudatus]|uniref:Mitogen-activated protein kinase kinase kinase 5-like n=1 Tax=Priapulus caudatus TaxID=37621 RepID=A0ABM1F4Z6_PRICU
MSRTTSTIYQSFTSPTSTLNENYQQAESLSRELSTAGTATPGTSDSEGFFMLKKDSERRATLVRVLEQDRDKICEVWLQLVHKDAKDTALTTDHLHVLIMGMRESIASNSKLYVHDTILTLKEDLKFAETALVHLKLALYVFQDAVNEVLKQHSIKPHWMFALDNLVRGVVNAAMQVLVPDGGLNSETDEPTTSGVSTQNSGQAQSNLVMFQAGVTSEMGKKART